MVEPYLYRHPLKDFEYGDIGLEVELNLRHGSNYDFLNINESERTVAGIRASQGDVYVACGLEDEELGNFGKADFLALSSFITSSVNEKGSIETLMLSTTGVYDNLIHIPLPCYESLPFIWEYISPSNFSFIGINRDTKERSKFSFEQLLSHPYYSSSLKR